MDIGVLNLKEISPITDHNKGSQRETEMIIWTTLKRSMTVFQLRIVKSVIKIIPHRICEIAMTKRLKRMTKLSNHLFEVKKEISREVRDRIELKGMMITMTRKNMMMKKWTMMSMVKIK